MSRRYRLSKLTTLQLAAITAEWLLGLIPLLWLAQSKSRRRMEWGIAWALFVSFVADGFAIGGLDADVVSNTYLFLQASLLVLAILDQYTALPLIALFAVTAVGSILYEGATGFNLWLPTVVGVVVCWIARRWAHPLRWSLALTFGAGGVAWYYWAWLVAHSPAQAALGSWCFQTARLLGVLAFVRATWPTRGRSMAGSVA